MAIQHDHQANTLSVSSGAPLILAGSNFQISTGVLVVGGGSQSAPRYTFSGDTTTGIYSPTAGSVSLTGGGTEQLRINAPSAANTDIELKGTGSLTLPRGNTSQRPSSPVNGMIRYNSQTNKVEIYENGIWTTFLVGTVAPVGASYIVASLDGTLTDDRQLAGTANQITIDDGGANGNMTLALAANPILPGVSAVTLPSGTTGDRTGSPVNGMMRYNSQTNKFEVYENGNWINIIGAGSAPSNAQYLVLALDGALTNERTLVGTSNQITLGDGGANGNATLAIADNPIIPGTGSITVPIGNTSQQPGSPVEGMIRYNSQTDRFEGYENSTWKNLITDPAPALPPIAPPSATYVTLSTDGDLTNERVLTQGSGITITDAGAGSTVTVGMTTPIPSLAAQAFNLLRCTGDELGLEFQSISNIISGLVPTFNVQQFTTPGTFTNGWTKPAGATIVIVLLWAGGGGGGGVDSAGGAGSGGGGGGAFNWGIFLAADLPSTCTVIVGAGGAGGSIAGGNGVQGGVTKFRLSSSPVKELSASGGGGGEGSTGSASRGGGGGGIDSGGFNGATVSGQGRGGNPFGGEPRSTTEPDFPEADSLFGGGGGASGVGGYGAGSSYFGGGGGAGGEGTDLASAGRSVWGGGGGGGAGYFGDSEVDGQVSQGGSSTFGGSGGSGSKDADGQPGSPRGGGGGGTTNGFNGTVAYNGGAGGRGEVIVISL